MSSCCGGVSAPTSTAHAPRRESKGKPTKNRMPCHRASSWPDQGEVLLATWSWAHSTQSIVVPATGSSTAGDSDMLAGCEAVACLCPGVRLVWRQHASCAVGDGARGGRAKVWAGAV